jgi:hypothetical protein
MQILFQQQQEHPKHCYYKYWSFTKYQAVLIGKYLSRFRGSLLPLFTFLALKIEESSYS